MKNICIGIALAAALTTPAFAQDRANGNEAVKETAQKRDEDNPIGLGFSINYYSKYIWRGIDFYKGDGYFYPSISWEMFGSGPKLTAAAEIASSWVFNGFRPKPQTYNFDFEGTPSKRKKDINNYAYANQGLDFAAEYSHTFEKIITIGASFWYYWYYNSKYATEMAWPKYESLNLVRKWDTSYFSAGINIGLDCVPWINPTVAVFYDNYVGYHRAGDYYIQLGFKHDFELVRDILKITPGVTAGYYYGRTYGYNNWYIASPGGADFDLGSATTDFIWRNHFAPKKGVSDVDLSVAMTATRGGFSFTSAFFWVITPAKSWYKGGPVHKYYAQVGIAYNL